MAYQKYNWKKGDAITAERLNNIEEGIAEKASSESTIIPSNSTNNSSEEAETFIVNGVIDEEWAQYSDVETRILFNKTIKEIYDTANTNKIVLLKLIIADNTLLIPLIMFSLTEAENEEMSDTYELIFSANFDGGNISVNVRGTENQDFGILIQEEEEENKEEEFNIVTFDIVIDGNDGLIAENFSRSYSNIFQKIKNNNEIKFIGIKTKGKSEIDHYYLYVTYFASDENTNYLTAMSIGEGYCLEISEENGNYTVQIDLLGN